jgi:CHASE2 domain-containing sensor protein
MGGYQQLDAKGYQILLNYRSNKSPLDIAEQVTLEDVLRDRITNPEMVKDKIVLIGVVSNDSISDERLTPYGAAPGVIIHAHMTSQILSAVLDGRPLLWVLPFWGEALWIWAWSMVGGILVWYVRHIFHIAVLSVITLGVLYGLSFGLLCVYGGWLPVVPATLALISTGTIVVVHKSYLNKKLVKLD